LSERPTFDISRVGPIPQRTGDEWWSGQPLGDGHLLLHRLPISDVYLTAAKNTLYIWALLGMVAILASVMVELRAAMAQVVRLTRTDPLTRVLNRRGFRESITQMVTTGRRLDISWSVLMVDIDHFKRVNDQFGHEEGDRVIVAVADVLQESMRDADMVCRWGGEEFAAFLFGTELEGACQLAERLRNKIEQAVRLPGGDPVTVSIGVTQAATPSDFDAVLGTADRELYRAKALGRNRVCST
jgi:diguanylate cyclase (GGDEF)-like protein